MTTALAPSRFAERMLRSLRASANDPTDPIHDEAIDVLLRRQTLIDAGYDPEIALDKAMEEHRFQDDTAAA